MHHIWTHVWQPETDIVSSVQYCQICNRGENEDLLLLCDGCDGSCHTYCHKPKITSIPSGDWFCPACVSRVSLHIIENLIHPYIVPPFLAFSTQLKRQLCIHHTSQISSVLMFTAVERSLIFFMTRETMVRRWWCDTHCDQMCHFEFEVSMRFEGMIIMD